MPGGDLNPGKPKRRAKPHGSGGPKHNSGSCDSWPLRRLKEPLPPEFLPEKLGAYSGGIRAATSQFSGAGEGGPNQLAFEAAVTNDVR